MNMNSRTRNIKVEIARNGISVSELAKKMELSTVSMSNKINGRTPFTLTEAKRLVDIFNSMESNVTVESIFFTDDSDISENIK